MFNFAEKRIVKIMNINFAKNQGYVQAVVQDIRTEKILRVGYINKISLDLMESSRQVVLWNNDKEEIQVITGGEYNTPLKLENIFANVEGHAVIIKALPDVSTTGADTFFGDNNIKALAFLSLLHHFI